jgi:SAM-dependent methyltransferase
MVEVCSLKQKLRLRIFISQNWKKEKFTCPVCKYRGPFKDVTPDTGHRKHAMCPSCGALERHRLQVLVIEKVFANLDISQKRMLHIAPEPFLSNFLAGQFGKYETADLNMYSVDYKVDIRNLPFLDASYDFVFASHVLEHISEDTEAIREVRRILMPGGIAILPVPLVCEKTVEYAEPNPHEAYHVRAPGYDYYDRYQPYFSKIDKYTSDSLPEEYQLYIYEDRTKWPSEKCPLRPPMPGERHIDIVPVGYA